MHSGGDPLSGRGPRSLGEGGSNGESGRPSGLDSTEKRVGQYQLLGLIALGGTAEVYKGYHPALDRYAVIKLLAPEFSRDEDWVRRFRQEARLWGKLDHPHILPIHDAGEHDRRPYLVTKWIENAVTLRSLLTGAPWPQTRVISIIRQIAEALEVAHGKGLVHRDVKPSNVLLAPGDHALVFDFGLAKSIRQGESDTQEGIIVGTPEYMSPEQCRGEEVDERSDVYALGVLAYEMLTGRVPFEAPSPMGVLMKHLTESIPTVAQSAPLTPPQHATLARAMSRAPRGRFASAREFSRALATASGQSPTLTLEVASSPTRSSVRWWRPRGELPSPRRIVAVFVGATIGLFLAALSLLWFLLASSTVEIPALPSVALPEPAAPAVSSSIESPTLEPSGLVEPSESLGPVRNAPELSRARPSAIATRVRPGGALVVDTNLPARVFLNDRELGTAPGLFQDVPSGRYTVSLLAEDGTRWNKDVLVSAGSRSRLTHRFTPKADVEGGSTVPVTIRPAPSEIRQPRRAELTEFTGYLTDDRCKAMGARDDHWRCMERCLREGSRPLLYMNGKLYPLEGLERITGDRNLRVTFEGTLDATTGRIRVQ